MSLPSYFYISANELEEKLRSKKDANLCLLDVRTRAEYADHYIPGTVNVPLDELEHGLDNIKKDTELVLICKSGKRAQAAAERLVKVGFKPEILEDGLTGWYSCGFSTAKRGSGLSIERQTQLVIGLGTLMGVIAGTLISPWFLLLPLFFGCGLTYAALSGNCGLAILLTKAPWNKGIGAGKSICGSGASNTSSSCSK